MGRADRVSGIFWLALGAFMAFESYRLGLGTLHQPGPGFLFFWASLALSFMSIAILIRAWTQKKTEKAEESIFGKQNTRKIVLFLISVFLYAFLLDDLGFVPVTLLLFFFLLAVLEKKRWGFAVWVSVLVTAVTYLVFETWLQSRLPMGILESLMF